MQQFFFKALIAQVKLDMLVFFFFCFFFTWPKLPEFFYTAMKRLLFSLKPSK